MIAEEHDLEQETPMKDRTKWHSMPLKHPIIWVPVIAFLLPLFFLLMQRMYEVNEVPLPFLDWWWILNLLMIGSWWTCFLTIALSPPHSWGGLLMVRLAYWPPGRSPVQTFGQAFMVATGIPIMIGFAVAFTAIAGKNTESMILEPIGLVGLTPLEVFLRSFALGFGLSFIPGVIVTLRIARIRGSQDVHCLACGTAFGSTPVPNCPECGTPY